MLFQTITTNKVEKKVGHDLHLRYVITFEYDKTNDTSTDAPSEKAEQQLLESFRKAVKL